MPPLFFFRHIYFCRIDLADLYRARGGSSTLSGAITPTQRGDDDKNEYEDDRRERKKQRRELRVVWMRIRFNRCEYNVEAFKHADRVERSLEELRKQKGLRLEAFRLILEPSAGIEPALSPLPRVCFTTKLRRRHFARCWYFNKARTPFVWPFRAGARGSKYVGHKIVPVRKYRRRVWHCVSHPCHQ